MGEHPPFEVDCERTRLADVRSAVVMINLFRMGSELSALVGRAHSHHRR